MNYHMELSHESDVQLFFLDFMKLILCPFHLLPQKIEKESDCHFSPQKFQDELFIKNFDVKGNGSIIKIVGDK